MTDTDLIWSKANDIWCGRAKVPSDVVDDGGRIVARILAVREGSQGAEIDVEMVKPMPSITATVRQLGEDGVFVECPAVVS